VDYKNLYNQMVSIVSAKYPSAQVVIGEFGRRALPRQQPDDNGPYYSSCPEQANVAVNRVFDESNQASALLDIINWAAAKQVPLYANWMLWDHSPKNTIPDSDVAAQVFGIGYTPNEPKDALGTIATRFDLVKNGDMENYFNGTDWLANATGISTTTIQLFNSNANAAEAAANLRFGRVQANKSCTSCRVWIQSGLFFVTPGKPMYVNAYIRSNMQNIRISVAQYDSAGNRLDDATGPMFTPTAWQWYSYLHQISGGWYANISANATRAYIYISGTPFSAPGYLDVDTVSVSQ
jgi:hypothetical protein